MRRGPLPRANLRVEEVQSSSLEFKIVASDLIPPKKMGLLACGDLSLVAALVVKIADWRDYQSGDKSPHSKRLQKLTILWTLFAASSDAAQRFQVSLASFSLHIGTVCSLKTGLQT